jgi:hypothetical protein
MDLSSVEIKLHPEGVLTHDTVFVGQIVRCVDLGRIGIVIRHKKGVKRRIPVLFQMGKSEALNLIACVRLQRLITKCTLHPALIRQVLH